MKIYSNNPNKLPEKKEGQGHLGRTIIKPPTNTKPPTNKPQK